MLPSMSFLTGVKATEPSWSSGESVSMYLLCWGAQLLAWKGVPKSVVSESAASRNSVVEMALSWVGSTGTSTKDLRIVSKKGLLFACEAAIFACRCWTLSRYPHMFKGGVGEEDVCRVPAEQTEQTNSMS